MLSSGESAPNCDSSQEKKPSNSQKRSYTEMSGQTSINKIVLSPIQENSEPPSSTKRFHMETRGARRLFSPENKGESERRIDHDEAGPSTSRQAETRETPFSPTLNLPNFVIDGTAPHLNESSPQKSKENVDWLTKIRKEKFEQKAKGSAEKQNSPKTQVTPARRSSRSKSNESRRTPRSPAGPLLNFFRPAVKDCERDFPDNNNDFTPSKTPPKF